MGALYEDVENFFGDIFAWYGRRVARRPLPFVVVPLLVCSLLGLGLFNIHYEADLETLYTPVNSRAMKDRSTLRRLFGPYSTPDQFYPHQVLLLSFPISHCNVWSVIIIPTRYSDG